MNKNLDYEISSRLDRQLSNDATRRSQRKTLLTRILKLSAKKSPDSYPEIGKLSFESGQIQTSLVQLKKATILDPTDYSSPFYLAKAYLKFEKENEAFSYLRKALLVSPSRLPRYQSAVIKILKERGKFDDLVLFYEETANMLTDTESIAYFYHGGAAALVSLNEYPKALEMYKKMCEIDSTDSQPRSGYALALYHEGLLEEALVQFEHAWKKDSRDGYVINDIAFIKYCLGRLEEAFEELEHLVAFGPMVRGTYSNFILVLYHLDEDDELLTYYKDLFQQTMGEDGPTLRSIYEEARGFTQALLERDDIDEETKEFNEKKIEGFNLVLSLIN